MFCDALDLSDLSNSLSDGMTRGQGIHYSWCHVFGTHSPREQVTLQLSYTPIAGVNIVLKHFCAGRNPRSPL